MAPDPQLATARTIPAADLDALRRPQVRLHGNVCDPFLDQMIQQFDAVPEGEGPIVLALTTSGGDADVGRRAALEIRLRRESTGRRILFLGQSFVYSAGVTLMSAFPREDRYLTADTVLLIHERRIEKVLTVSGPLRAAGQIVGNLLSEIEQGVRLEREGFAQLIAGTDVGEDELLSRAEGNWYVPAQEALGRRLVAGLL